MIDVCAEFGLVTTRVEGRSGAWVTADEHGGSGAGGSRPDRKVGATGIRVARGTTLHGFAINANCDLSVYDKIVPCGIRDAGITSISAELGREITVDDLLPVTERRLEMLFA
jgi:lipoyl(octanoyl) transferase